MGYKNTNCFLVLDATLVSAPDSFSEKHLENGSLCKNSWILSNIVEFNIRKIDPSKKYQKPFI